MIEATHIDEAVYALGISVDGRNYLLGTGFSAYYADAIWTNAHVTRALRDTVSRIAYLDPIPFAVKSGTKIGGSHTYVLDVYFVHPNYDGTANSPDVAVLVIDADFVDLPQLLPRTYASQLRVGQPVGTFGFPGEIGNPYEAIPIGTFKDGTISALRPFSQDSNTVTPENSRFVQHNLDLSPGTSGSLIFDHYGYVIAINNSGTTRLVFDATTGQPTRIPTGNVGFGVRIDEVWHLIDLLETQREASDRAGLTERMESRSIEEARLPRGVVSLSVYPHRMYLTHPNNWNGETLLPDVLSVAREE